MNIYGYIYRITNLKNGKVYIGQTKHTFKKRYGGLSINNVEKKTTNKELKKDIELLNSDDYWSIEPELDVAYSAQELNEKENSLMMQYVWDNMEHKKRKDFANAFYRPFEGEGKVENPWHSWEGDKIPDILYNKVTPTHKKSKDSSRKYIYIGDKMCIVFTSQAKVKSFINANCDEGYSSRGYPMRPYFSGSAGVFYLNIESTYKTINSKPIPRVNNLKRCITSRNFGFVRNADTIARWQGSLDFNSFREGNMWSEKEGRFLVEYTGKTYRVRRIYKPHIKVRIQKVECIKNK